MSNKSLKEISCVINSILIATIVSIEILLTNFTPVIKLTSMKCVEGEVSLITADNNLCCLNF